MLVRLIIRLIVYVSFCFCTSLAGAREYRSGKTYNSYRGLVMAGYQGWQNTPDDGANRGWHHYTGRNGFRPGSTNVDLWPDVSEYEKTYETPFKMDDGTTARLYSPYDASTVDTHFRWMQEYGLDGVFMQRFVAEIRNESGKHHFNHVLTSAMTAANKYERAICVMYDLSGMHPGEEQLLLDDIQELAKEHSIKEHAKNPSYLYHNGKPLVAVWGVGFNDHRQYGFKEAQTIINSLRQQGFSILLGVPTHWRRLETDTESDSRLHDLIRQCDIVMPWFVGRYDEKLYNQRYRQHILDDIAWAKQNKVDYAPLCYPGFSWHNMHYPRVPDVEIPRNGGRFFQMQLDYVISSGAEMIYIAMFDEIDEGTAIYKIARKVPVGTPGSVFVPLEEGVSNDRYLKLAGDAAKKLKTKAWGQVTEPVDYVNPYIGNISHLLVPTFPTVHLPNSMLRVYPERADFTAERVSGLPIIVTNHRERSAFKLMPQTTAQPQPTIDYTYENERLTPYSYQVDLDDCNMSARLAVSHQSAIYEIDFHDGGQRYITLSSQNGEVKSGDNWLSGWQTVSGQTKVYVWLESDKQPLAAVSVSDKCKALRFPDDTHQIHLRYGISFISEEQARQNLRREQSDYDVDALAAKGRDTWNETLSRLSITGGTDNERTVFYSSYYRTFERPISMSEDGHYWSAYDNQVHDDGGQPFYTDDWIWDTYRAAHPLRVLTDRLTEERIIDSYLTMAEQMGTGWMPTFPEVNGDSRRMNSNHGVAMVADALAKGLTVDAVKAYDACRKGIEEKTLAPWSGNKAGWIDQFYKTHGYIPALAPGEQEFDPNVNRLEKRQPVAVTLGTSYDEWCLSRIADYLSTHTKNKKQAKAYAAEAQKYLQLSLNYRNLWNADTKFFHPKDSNGHFIEPFDYRYSGGQGAREYYGENNGWTYRFDVQHNIPDLIDLMGGNEAFVKAMDQSFIEPLGESKFEFFSHLPDHTGNVGMFSMANEPSFHIPYLYNYAGQPWKTQRCIRKLLNTWYRNDLMGVPGDEDGGGMTAFVVFSMIGFYPVTPGTDIYSIGSPVFTDVKIRLSNGKTFEVIAHGASDENKYIQQARLNGNELNTPFITHEAIMQGGVLELQMGSRPKK